MCDEEHLAAMRGSRISRRQFGKFGAVATPTALAPLDAARAQGRPSESTVTFDCPDGKMDAFFVHQTGTKLPAVIVWPDIAGLRDSFMAMSRRLAREGYAVLLLNPYYRDAEAPQFDDFDAFRNDGGSDKVTPWRAKLTAEAVMATAKAVVAFLDQDEAIDTGKGIGVQGYCMGGPFAVWTAAAAPERVKAAASFHGGGLVGEEATAPVKVLGQTQASFLFAIAKNDDARAPGDKDALKAAAAAAGRPAEIKVYKGDHGWTVADSRPTTTTRTTPRGSGCSICTRPRSDEPAPSYAGRRGAASPRARPCRLPARPRRPCAAARRAGHDERDAGPRADRPHAAGHGGGRPHGRRRSARVAGRARGLLRQRRPGRPRGRAPVRARHAGAAVLDDQAGHRRRADAAVGAGQVRARRPAVALPAAVRPSTGLRRGGAGQAAPAEPADHRARRDAPHRRVHLRQRRVTRPIRCGTSSSRSRPTIRWPSSPI